MYIIIAHQIPLNTIKYITTSFLCVQKLYPCASWMLQVMTLSECFRWWRSVRYWVARTAASTRRHCTTDDATESRRRRTWRRVAWSPWLPTRQLPLDEFSPFPAHSCRRHKATSASRTPCDNTATSFHRKYTSATSSRCASFLYVW